MAETVTFSRLVKDELTELCARDNGYEKLCLLSGLFAAARLRSGQLQLSTLHAGYAELVSDLFIRVYQQEVQRQTGRELITLSVNSRAVYRKISEDLRRIFGYDTVHNSLFMERSMSDQQLQAVIRGMFLACGSIGDPRTAYHLEFSIRRLPAALWMIRQLPRLSLSGHLLRRQGYNVVYLKEGQQVAELLLQCGAHQSLLDFEVLRVEKEMRNSVNRVVNCDNANSQRIANASARQLDLLRSLDEIVGLGILPEDLMQAARARLAHPDLSLRELGETMNPPLGKSGMNHRLKRIERIAQERLNRRE